MFAFDPQSSRLCLGMVENVLDCVNQSTRYSGFLEVFKPKRDRIYGYYCLPVLAGDQLVARLDLKADRKAGRLKVLSVHFEDGKNTKNAARGAVRTALERFSDALGLSPLGP